MHQLNDQRRARANYTPESFFNMLTKVATMGEQGLICLLTSKNDKPLGFGVGFSAVDFNGDACFYVWAAYSNAKCKTTLNELLSACEMHAKTLEFNSVKMATPRITGAAFRLFEERLGFSREYITFKKNI